MKLINRSTNEQLAEEIGTAYSFWGRLRGLMFTKEIRAGCGLHIRPCKQIHSFFMNYSIDVLFVNDENVIVGVESHFPPYKIGRVYREASSVIELPAGTIEETQTEIGNQIQFIK